MKQRPARVSIPEITESLAQIPKDSNIFIDKSMDISRRIYLLMLANNWIQKDLAEKMGKKEAEISKLLSGTHNYTLRTISNIESVLNEDIIKVPVVTANKFETQTINVRVTQTTKDELQKLADADQRTLSDYIRLQLEKIINSGKKR